MRRCSNRLLDVVVPAPKSVSVLWGVHNRKRKTRLIHDAHMSAVTRAVVDLQKQAGMVQIGAAWYDMPVTVYRLEHCTGVAEEPHLHTHLLVDTELRDGQQRGSLDVSILQDALELVGLQYQVSLEQELWRRLQLGFEQRRRGTRQLCGIDEDLMKAFADGSCTIGLRQFTATA
ncbi:relaxase domain-containing protein [Streptacidiphilus fuscans]|nr:relaxase domain-containing protein [Streptacidiphilus fuscans]